MSKPINNANNSKHPELIQMFKPCYQDYLSNEEKAAIDHEISLLETKEAAGIEALKVVQSHRKWISDDSLFAIAEYLAIPSAQLDGVATFYNLIYRQPVGKHVIHICNSISCHLTGHKEVLFSVKEYLSIEYGQTTTDGLFTLLSNACLGCCDKSPAMMVGQHLYTNLSPEKAQSILAVIKEKDLKLQQELGEEGNCDCP